MADDEGAITVETVLAAHQALEGQKTLSDLGVGTLTWWAVHGTCSRHGRLVRFEETPGGPPKDPYLDCMACRQEGLKRKCPVEDLERLTGGSVPTIGGL